MDRRSFLLASAAGGLALAAGTARAQDTRTLRFHTMVSRDASLTVGVIDPWIKRIEEAAGGTVKIEIYPLMQLGGSPTSLFDQVKDGAVDFTQTVVGYSPGRFPKTETLELPFLVTNAEQTSVAAQRFVNENSLDEFAEVKLICVNTHGPGLLHTKRPIEKLEDLKGMKIRAGSPVVHDLLRNLGAEPIPIPVPQMAEALTTGVIEGATFPWDLTPQLRLSELVRNHTSFSGAHGLYTLVFIVPMNLAAYESLPDEAKAAFDAESSIELARQMGKASDASDIAARKIAEDLGNNLIVLDETETARWVEAAQPTIEGWYAAREAQGIDGQALHARAKELIAAEAGG